MANHKSAKKRARQTVKRNELNRSRRSTIRTLAKESEVASASGNPVDVTKALQKAESALAKGAARGTLHWKTAARKTSRLAKRAKAAAKKA
jgi:small subunit ribosomal protein S20